MKDLFQNSNQITQTTTEAEAPGGDLSKPLFDDSGTSVAVTAKEQCTCNACEGNAPWQMDVAEDDFRRLDDGCASV